MGRDEQRSISRRLIRNAHDSRLLHRMAGIRNVHKVGDVLADAQDDGMLDSAIDAVIQNERRNPGAVDPDSVGFQLCRHLLQVKQAA